MGGSGSKGSRLDQFARSVTVQPYGVLGKAAGSSVRSNPPPASPPSLALHFTVGKMRDELRRAPGCAWYAISNAAMPGVPPAGPSLFRGHPPPVSPPPPANRVALAMK